MKDILISVTTVLLSIIGVIGLALGVFLILGSELQLGLMALSGSITVLWMVCVLALLDKIARKP